ncbi:DegT/DnrJ/EryC1/StrS aminotransferase family protein [soil metagenome]
MIPLMKNAFLHETETRRALAEFILTAERFSMSTKCLEFELAFAKAQGRREAVLFNSGGSANLAILQALKNLGRLQDGARIGFSALTWSTNVMPIIQLGMTPVAVDCEPTTLNVMSMNLAQVLATEKLDALFITNALGFAGDLDAIRSLCEANGIILLEDNCESLGTELPSGRAGNFGAAASFSFFVAHHMSTIEGGMVCTDDEDLAEMLCIVRANGWDRNLNARQQIKWRKQYKVSSEFDAKYTFYDLGYNLRPTEFTGFIGLIQLQYLAENIAIRARNYATLEKVALENPDLVPLDRSHLTLVSAFALPVMCKTPALKRQYVEQFSGAGVEVRPMIAGNMQRQPFYSKYVQEMQPLPGADFVHDCGFYCGNYPELTSADLETLSACLHKY